MKNTLQRKFLLFIMLTLVLVFKCFFEDQNKQATINPDEKISDFNYDTYSNIIPEKSFVLNRHLLSATKQTKSHRQASAVFDPTTASNHNKSKVLCYPPDIEQFPKGVFDQSDRLKGAVIIHFLIALYMFVGLAIVCDEYFVPSLSSICKFLNLKEDVAGKILYSIILNFSIILKIIIYKLKVQRLWRRGHRR
jgi:hypothetical protein